MTSHSVFVVRKHLFFQFPNLGLRKGRKRNGALWFASNKVTVFWLGCCDPTLTSTAILRRPLLRWALQVLSATFGGGEGALWNCLCSYRLGHWGKGGWVTSAKSQSWVSEPDRSLTTGSVLWIISLNTFLKMWMICHDSVGEGTIFHQDSIIY